MKRLSDVKIDKMRLVEQIKAQISADFEALKKAALATYEDATHEESKPENEYDTRGLEASYLAGAQGKRLAEIEEIFAMYNYLQLKKFTAKDAIELSAVVEVEHNGKINHVFIVPKGGGMTLAYEGLNIQLIATTSPLGEALLGLEVSDIAVIDSGARELEYEILDVQ